MDSDKQLSFLRTQNCFSQELLEPNFSMGGIIGEKLSHKLWEPLLANQTLRKQIPLQSDPSSSAIKIVTMVCVLQLELGCSKHSKGEVSGLSDSIREHLHPNNTQTCYGKFQGKF